MSFAYRATEIILLIIIILNNPLRRARNKILRLSDWFWDYILRKMPANWRPGEKLTRMMRSFKHTTLEEMGRIQTVAPRAFCLDVAAVTKAANGKWDQKHTMQIGKSRS